MDAADCLEAGEGGMDPLEPEFAESCDGCAIPITWIDRAMVCGHGCTWCMDCAEGNAMVCPTCSADLVRRARRTRGLS